MRIKKNKHDITSENSMSLVFKLHPDEDNPSYEQVLSIERGFDNKSLSIGIFDGNYEQRAYISEEQLRLIVEWYSDGKNDKLTKLIEFAASLREEGINMN